MIDDSSELDAEAPTIDSARYRQVLGHFPTGVVVVTAADPDGPVGLAIGSFTSVSLDPPLVGFLPGGTSTSWPRIQAAGTFAVNILSDDQEDVSRVFASKGTEKFDGIGWRPAAATGSPVIDGVLAWIDCRIEAVADAGDHFWVLGRVVDLGVADTGAPLVFFRGGYGRFTL